MKKISLSSGHDTLVDDDDYNKYSKHNWWLNCNGYTYRQVQNNYKVKTIFLHRIVAETPEGLDTDHINRNKLDNRRSNLRVVTRSQNMLNINPTKSNRSGYVGVSLHKKSGRWRAYVTINGKQKSFGYYKTPNDAYEARINNLERLGICV